MKKIIHFSDLHIGFENLGARFLCIIENLLFVKNPPSDYVIVITGDLVENAADISAFEEARSYVERLRNEHYAVLVIPGNHDYGTGSLGSEKYVKRFKETFFIEYDKDETYPKVDFIDGTAFIGLDSMAEELHWYDSLFANGEIGEAQLSRLDTTLKNPDVSTAEYKVIYMHHHPFDPINMLHKLKDADNLKNLLRKHDKIDAFLYGHNHLGKKRNGVLGIPRCYDAGSSTRKNNSTGSHRVIDLSRDPRLDYDADFHGNY